MSLKTAIASRVINHILSPERLARQREKIERRRRKADAPHVLEYFHEAGDAYSHLMLGMLVTLTARYDVEVKTHLVGPPPDWAAPERGQLEAYARKDAARLAARLGADFSDTGNQPSPGAVSAANNAFAQRIRTGDFLAEASKISAALWAGKGGAEDAAPDTLDLIASGDARREALGHYLGATLYYGGEWYWGPDRLHYLEARLCELGTCKGEADTAPAFPPPLVPAGFAEPGSDRSVLHYYLSFRSPYTYIAARRAKALAEAYGAELRLRYVLPMVMRGLPVPRMKSMYIARDVAREATRLGIPYGRIADPVGKPVERGYALLHGAVARGRGYEFALSFMEGVWSEGLDAGSDATLRIMVERAGLDWTDMKPLLDADDWRAEAEANREEMMALGIWGVPSFRVGEVAAWGQDRLWLIEDALASLSTKQKDIA